MAKIFLLLLIGNNVVLKKLQLTANPPFSQPEIKSWPGWTTGTQPIQLSKHPLYGIMYHGSMNTKTTAIMEPIHHENNTDLKTFLTDNKVCRILPNNMSLWQERCWMPVDIIMSGPEAPSG